MKALASRLLGRVADASIFFSFDRTGFERHQRGFEPNDLDVDLGGKRCLVTGANSGIGRATALGLASLGAEVWLLCRSEDRGRQAEGEIRLASRNDQVFLELVDMASRASIEAFVERLGDRSVDVLIHNAGVLPERRIETKDGLELTWATNVFGPFLMTRELVPNLRRAEGARVISVSSGGMYTQQLDLRDIAWQKRPFDGVAAYAQTKRAGVILTEQWAERLATDSIAVNCMHPGWADTPSVRQALPRFWRFTQGRLRSPRQGADTLVWLAACERIASESGKFWFDRKAVSTHLLKRTRERLDDRKRLWDLCWQQTDR